MFTGALSALFNNGLYCSTVSKVFYFILSKLFKTHNYNIAKTVWHFYDAETPQVGKCMEYNSYLLINMHQGLYLFCSHLCELSECVSASDLKECRSWDI